MGIFTKRKNIRPDICMVLNSTKMDEMFYQVDACKEKIKYVEWRVETFPGIEEMTKEEYTEKLTLLKNLVKPKLLIVKFHGDETVNNRILRWSMGIADFIDVEFENEQASRLIREAHKKKSDVIVSFHDFDKMLSKEEISELFLKMEKTGGDILKVCCMANEEIETYNILEGAASYTQLKKHKPIIAIAMGEQGQVSRICAGEFGSRITYAFSETPSAPGQFSVSQLSKYLDSYYKEKK